MGKPPSTTKPQFFWQGILILLPVLALAVIGALLLHWDWQTTHEDAQKAGNAMVQQKAEAIEPVFATQLADYTHAAHAWHQVQHERFGLASPQNRDTDASRLLHWIRDHPQWRPESVFLPETVLSSKGEWLSPRPYLHRPQPASWRLTLTAHHAVLWESALVAQFQGNDTAAVAALEDFIYSGPPPEAQANAEFLLLGLQAAGQNGQDLLHSLLNFRHLKSHTVTEGGISLSQLACYRAAQLLTNDQGVPSALLEAVAWNALKQPSFLIPDILEELSRAADEIDAEGHDKSAELVRLWHQSEAVRLLLNRLASEAPPSKWPRAFWTESDTGINLVTIAPVPMNAIEHFDKAADTDTHPAWRVRVIPQPVVEDLFMAALNTAAIQIPRYLALTAELHGKVLVIPGSEENPSLTAWAGHSSQLKFTGPNGEAFELPFTLVLHLSDPSQLYSRMRQRSVGFGLLIAAAAAVAVAGFISTRRAVLRLIQVNEQQSNFTASVSHELRTPIASLQLMAEGMERGRITDPQKQKEYFTYIRRECRRLAALVQNILDFTLSEQGVAAGDVESCDLLALVEQTACLMRPLAEEQQVRLELQLNAEAVSKLDPQLHALSIQRALINLVDNAIKHSPTGAAVILGLDAATADAPGQVWIQLWVEDQGPGIRAEEHERIFDRFYRLGSELRRQTQGVGIGLSLVKRIMEAHGGTVLLRSQPGEGSRFTLRFPVHQVNQPSPPSNHEPHVPSPRRRG